MSLKKFGTWRSNCFKAFMFKLVCCLQLSFIRFLVDKSYSHFDYMVCWNAITMIILPSWNDHWLCVRSLLGKKIVFNVFFWFDVPNLVALFQGLATSKKWHNIFDFLCIEFSSCETRIFNKLTWNTTTFTFKNFA
jgi:hypothetical protein